jgi:hypothetical protein
LDRKVGRKAVAAVAIFKVLYDPLNIVDASDNPLVAASLNDALVVRRLLYQFGVRSAFIGLFLDREPVQMRNGVGGALARPQTPTNSSAYSFAFGSGIGKDTTFL